MLFFNKTAVGLELDAREVRAVELGGRVKAPVLKTFGRIGLPEGAVEEGMVKKPDLVGNAICDLWRQKKFKNKKVIVGVSNQGVLVRRANFPKVPDDRLDQLVRYQAQEYIPVPIDSVVLDYMPIGDIRMQDRVMQQILLVAAQLEMLDGFLEALSAAKLVPLDMDVISLALVRMIPPEDKNKVVVVVNIDNELGNILIAARGIPQLARMIRVNMTKAFGSDFNYDFKMDAQMKDMMQRWSESIIVELSSSMNYYQSLDNSEMVNKIYLSGCGNRIKGLLNMIQDYFDMPVELLDTLSAAGITCPGDEYMTDVGTDFAACISLALRGLE